MKQYVFYMALGFMLGGLMFSQWLPKLLTGTDIRALSGDGNPGAFNVFRHCGAALGASAKFCPECGNRAAVPEPRHAEGLHTGIYRPRQA